MSVAAAAEWLAPARWTRPSRCAPSARTPRSSPAARSSASSSTRASSSRRRCCRGQGGGAARAGGRGRRAPDRRDGHPPDVERDPRVREGPALARAFGLVASPRVRNQATAGGVLADADYASDPPAMLSALEARVVLRSPRRAREVAVADLILGHYETCIEPDELLVEVRVPAPPDGPYTASSAPGRARTGRASRSRPRAATAASASSSARSPTLPGTSPTRCGSAIRGRRPRIRRADRSHRDARGSAAYRRRVTAVEVRRAIEALG